jgi:hypothetical protein
MRFLTLPQASFVALNVEPESDTEEDIDDSKEIQVGIFRINHEVF